MANTTFQADLLSTAFPYSFKELGSCVIAPTALETSKQTPSSLHGTDAERQAGYSHGYYLENVIPTARGYSSAGFTKLAQCPSSVPFEHVIEVRSADNSLVQIGVRNANIYISKPDGTWKTSTVLRDAGVAPQTAVVRGTTYVYFGTFTVYEYDSSTNELIIASIPALGSTTIRGIVSAGAQLVVHDEETIYYSSVLDALDFQKDLATGAGSTKVLALRGSISFCAALGSNFVIYTQYNAVIAKGTGSLAFPFIFNEISGSIGAVKLEHVAGNSNTGVHIVYTTAGFQQVSTEGAEFIWPELGDGISRGLLPTIDTLTETPKLVDVDKLNVRMSFIADRWVCVSLGSDPEVLVYTDCFLFDTSLKRWGRLKVSHTCIFQWNLELVEYSGSIRSYQDWVDQYPIYDDVEPELIYLDLSTITSSNASLTKNRAALCSTLGSITAFDVHDADIAGDTTNKGGTDAATPRLILGKYKVSRNSGVVFQYLRCNKLIMGTIVLRGHDYNGDMIRARSTLVESPRHKDTWYARMSADAISIEFQGTFSLTDLSVTCSNAGTMNSYGTVPKKFDRLLLSSLYPVEAEDSYAVDTTFFDMYTLAVPTWNEISTPNTELIYIDLQATYVWKDAAVVEDVISTSDTTLTFIDLNTSYTWQGTSVDDTMMSAADTVLLNIDLQSTYIWIYSAPEELQVLAPSTILLGVTLV